MTKLKLSKSETQKCCCELCFERSPVCCGCPPRRLCLQLIFDADDYGNKPCDDQCTYVTWDCDNLRYYSGNVASASVRSPVDVTLTFETDDYGDCYLVLESQTLGLVDRREEYGVDDRLWQRYDNSGCQNKGTYDCTTVKHCVQIEYDLTDVACCGAATLRVTTPVDSSLSDPCGYEVDPCCPVPPNTGVQLAYDSYYGVNRDAVWTFDGPEGSDVSPFVPADEDLNWNWLGNTTVSRWLSSKVSPREDPTDATDTTRTYKIEWEIPNHIDYCRHKMYVRVAVDNRLMETRLNGTVVPGGSTPSWIKMPCDTKEYDGYEAHMGFNTVFELPVEELQHGINVLEFETKNIKHNCTAPWQDGFRAEFSCCYCEAAPPRCRGLLNTGVAVGRSVSQGSGPYDTCSADAVWREVNHGANLIVAKRAHCWVEPRSPLDNGGSRWLSVYCDGEKVAGTLTFQYEIDFEVLRDADKLMIEGYYTVDNELNDILLNGVSQGISCDLNECDPLDPCGRGCYDSWHYFQICDGLRLGTNTLSFITVNKAGTNCSGPFQAGFRCELRCSFHPCVWIPNDSLTGWVKVGDSCPDGWECPSGPTTTPSGDCDEVRKCCEESYP